MLAGETRKVRCTIIRKGNTELWELGVVCAGNALKEEMAATHTLKAWPSRHQSHLLNCSYHAS